MKNLIHLCAILTLPLSAPAQQMIWQNDICPDWTFTDITGTEHNLYTYLDQGYTVFFDASTTWCPPCWDIHESHILDSLFLNYGPGTTANNIMVFLIETDDATTLDDLNGTGNNTLGDWVSGTPYPIIDNAESLRDLLHFNSVPFVWSVCPNRSIGPGYSSTMAEMATTAQVCEDFYLADSPSDAALLHIVDWTRCRGQQQDIKVRLQNVGTEPLTSVSIETTFYPHQDWAAAEIVDTLEWTGSLATYAYEEVSTTQLDLPMGMHSIGLRLLMNDDFDMNNSMAQGALASTVAASTEVTLELLTDGNAANLSWSLYTADGAVVVDASPLGAYSNNTFYAHTWDLQDDECYAFSIYSNNSGAGIAAPGYFQLLAGGIPFSGAAALRYNVEVVDFLTDADVGVNELLPNGRLIVLPNPIVDRAQVDLRSLHGIVSVSWMDAVGRLVKNGSAVGGSMAWIERGSLPPGYYTLMLRDAANRTISGRVIVQ